MKRPAFQFYTGDWQKNAKLRRCSPAARGVWVDVLCLMHDSDEYGVLRWPLKDVANAAGASMALVRELVTKGVLKGAEKDAEPYVYRPNHAGKLGDPVILVVPEGGPVWYSSRFVRDEYVRQRRGEGTRFGTDNQPAGKAAAAKDGTERERLRAAVFAKTGGFCAHCKAALTDAWEIDHFVPRARGGSNLFTNLVPACVPCNQDKFDSMPEDWTPASGPTSRSPTRRFGDPQGDGPSSSSSPSGSEAKASGAADAPPVVDKSTGTEQPISPKRLALRACGDWLMANGLAEVTAREVMGKVLKDFPDVAVQALTEAPKQAETPNPQAWLIAMAQKLVGDRVRAAASKHPTPTAEQTAATEAARRAEFEAAQRDPEGQAAVAAARERLAATRARIDGPGVPA